jgi:uncharacterized RDD family membrane protein YckC
MDDTRELVDASKVGAALAVLSCVALLLSLGFAITFRSRRGAAPKKGALLAGAAVLTWPLWLVYNAIEDHFGLDSVAALLLNLALFAVIGTAGGFLMRRLWPYADEMNRQDAKSAKEVKEV